MTLTKRLFDVIIALAVGLVLLPVLAVLCVVLLVSEGRPLFYISERMRSPTEPFNLIKLRTMRVGAGDGGVTGGNKAAAMSRIHRLMRRSRADELPQLWNVLRGDISLVGPRPPLRVYVEAYPEIYNHVLQSRPGITGLASLRFHAHEEKLLAACGSAAETDAVYRRRCIPRKARLDLIYQARRSLCYDLVLLAETAAKPFRRGG
jgi:lipopolysaccharide/colanic/teichoic acid biosynthesis glycosyltransferase